MPIGVGDGPDCCAQLKIGDLAGFVREGTVVRRSTFPRWRLSVRRASPRALSGDNSGRSSEVSQNSQGASATTMYLSMGHGTALWQMKTQVYVVPPGLTNSLAICGGGFPGAAPLSK